VNYGLPKELCYEIYGHQYRDFDPRMNLVKWYIARERLLQFGLALYPVCKNIYHILWITEFLDFFEYGDKMGPYFTDYWKIKALGVFELMTKSEIM
jgi:hypothetical protein